MPEQRSDVLRAYIGARGNHHHKTGRAFERTSYRFDILGDYGAFRDLQRHRVHARELARPVGAGPRLDVYSLSAGTSCQSESCNVEDQGIQPRTCASVKRLEDRMVRSTLPMRTLHTSTECKRTERSRFK